MKRFCPHCGLDQFGRIPLPPARIRCRECGASLSAGDLVPFHAKPWWWYWSVLPWLVAPAFASLVAPLLDRLFPGRHLDAGVTFWALVASPLFLYLLSGWILASHRLARWYFGAVLAALVLTVLNLFLAAVLFLARG